ncbi:MAG: hypothetical protein L4877_01540 [Aigarchaeota archaeon]|nr:hypothetical protein [Candidatus Geocrenenecus dongiae]
MVGGIYRTVSCTKYAEGKKYPAPALEITLHNMVGEKVLEKIKFPIDTGYEGSIMLTSDLYQHFLIAELPRILWKNYKTLTGMVTMRIARAIVKLSNGIEFETFVETPLFGTGKLLIGRELLNKLTIILDGNKENTCIAEEVA